MQYENTFEDLYREPSNPFKTHYKELSMQFMFISERYTADGLEDIYLYTTIDLVYKIIPGNYSPLAESPDDYYDTYTLVAWNAISVVDENDDEVNPENILTDSEYKRYTLDLQNFVDE